MTEANEDLSDKGAATEENEKLKPDEVRKLRILWLANKEFESEGEESCELQAKVPSKEDTSSETDQPQPEQSNMEENLPNGQQTESGDVQTSAEELLECKEEEMVDLNEELTPRPRRLLRRFVMSEDSLINETQTQVEVSSSPSPSEIEVGDVIKAVQDLMEDFELSLPVVMQALLKNSGELQATRHFLRFGERPDGFPLWSVQDDKDLETSHEGAKERLVKKYGSDNITKRIAFLKS